MLTLNQLAPIFATLDGKTFDAPYEKALRNLASRQFLPPTEVRGRNFHFDRAAVATIWLAHTAAKFGVPRLTIDVLAQWLGSASTRLEEVEGGQVAISRAAEALQRVEAGEVFSLSIVLPADNRLRIVADWTPDEAPSARVSALLDARLAPEVARFSLPASALIGKLLLALPQD